MVSLEENLFSRNKLNVYKLFWYHCLGKSSLYYNWSLSRNTVKYKNNSSIYYFWKLTANKELSDVVLMVLLSGSKK